MKIILTLTIYFAIGFITGFCLYKFNSELVVSDVFGNEIKDKNKKAFRAYNYGLFAWYFIIPIYLFFFVYQILVKPYVVYVKISEIFTRKQKSNNFSQDYINEIVNNIYDGLKEINKDINIDDIKANVIKSINKDIA